VCWFEHVCIKGTLSVADEVLTPEAAIHHCGLKGVAEDKSTPEDNKKFRTEFAAAFPDLHWDIHEIMAEEDKAATRHAN